MNSRSQHTEPSPVRLSHPDKVLYPETHITKEELASYYEQIADVMLPFVKERPLSFVRCPEGIEASCFFQKHPGNSIPNLPTTRISEKRGKHEYGIVKSMNDLLRLVQANVLEIHSWGCSLHALEHPDQIVFDLDPGPEIDSAGVIEASYILRNFLEELGLRSFVRLSGGKGLHVVSPLEPRHSWEETKNFTQRIAQSLEEAAPEHFVSVSTKSKRNKRIFVDYLRNGRGATAIANYSTRARPGATVALPVEWEDLESHLDPGEFTVSSVPNHISRLKKTPWAEFFKTRQSLPNTRAFHFSV